MEGDKSQGSESDGNDDKSEKKDKIDSSSGLNVDSCTDKSEYQQFHPEILHEPVGDTGDTVLEDLSRELSTMALTMLDENNPDVEMEELTDKMTYLEVASFGKIEPDTYIQLSSKFSGMAVTSLNKSESDVEMEELTNEVSCMAISSPDKIVPVGPECPTSSEVIPGIVKQTHKLKWIQWNGIRTAIVTQNENGPCPLIAIANILLLRGKIVLPANCKELSASELLEYVGDAIVDNTPKGMTSNTVLNYEQNMHDAIAVLPNLPTGLNVNIKFTGVRHFEYTPECVVFDLLNIPLYHGWLVDPQAHETVAALGNYGYNQIVERIIINKGSDNADLVTEALVAEEFLERTATQLTYHGLCELNSTMEQGELAVLFRNNHFSTVVKKQVCICTEDAATQILAKEELNELFLLVTDQGFLHESRVVWETLCSIDGDGQFVDSSFVTVTPLQTETYIPPKTLSQDQQINHE